MDVADEYEDGKRHPRVWSAYDQARGFFLVQTNNGVTHMTGRPFVFKLFLKIISAALLLCGGASLLSAQTAATLDEVVVTANRAEESRREVTSNVTVIGEEDIAASTAATLADLAAEHGLQVYTSGDTGNVYIRGFGSGSMASEIENSVLTLVNGRRIGNANLALLGLANVQRIEIIRGPAAVQYGPAAMGGVINVITKQGVGMDAPYVSAEMGIGSDALHRERISFGGAGGGFDFALGFTNYGRDDVTTPDGRRWYNTEISRNTSLNTDFGYTITDSHRVGINFNYGSIDSRLPNSGIRPYENNTPDSSFGRYIKSNQNIALNYAGHTRDKSFDWSAIYSFGSDDREYPSYEYTATTENRAFNAQAGYTADFVSLSAGVDYLRYKSLPYTWQPDENIKEDTGIYFTGKLRLLDERLIFSAGGRYDSYSSEGGSLPRQDYGNFGGSVGAAYLPVKWLKLRANYAEGFRVPSTSQMSGDGRTTAPNPGLRPEKSKTVEFGTDINWNFIDAALTYFHSNWDDKIFWLGVVGLPDPFTAQNQNLKASTLAGLEGALRTDIGKAFGKDYGLTPYVEFTLLGTRRNEDEDQFIVHEGNRIDTLPNTPKWMVSYGLDYNNPALKLKSRLSASRYGEVFTPAWELSGPPTWAAPWIARPAGTVVNLSVERELARFRERGGALTLRAEINNLFDGKNEMFWSYPGAGRGFYTSLRYNFD
jgi:vitamin B12 transporter